MRVLVACEFSGRVRQAFRDLGHDAWSCDLLPAEDSPEFHIQDDIFYSFDNSDTEWDLLIAHPPCTYLCNSGVRWLYHSDGSHNHDRWEEMEDAINFFLALRDLPIPRKCIENPIPHKYAIESLGRPTQYIQPYEFGEDASKKTGLWLKGLPKLQPTEYIDPKIINGKKRWNNQAPCGADKTTPSSTRGLERSRTYKGIAKAMAEQWGNL